VPCGHHVCGSCLTLCVKGIPGDEESEHSIWEKQQRRPGHPCPYCGRLMVTIGPMPIGFKSMIDLVQEQTDEEVVDEKWTMVEATRDIVETAYGKGKDHEGWKNLKGRTGGNEQVRQLPSFYAFSGHLYWSKIGAERRRAEKRAARLALKTSPGMKENDERIRNIPRIRIPPVSGYVTFFRHNDEECEGH
jgi:hypothetical protein